MTADDSELVLQVQRGDVRAFEELVHRYDRRVLSIALSYAGNTEDAKDIYQEVFIRAYRSLSKFQFRSRFSTWLYRIAINVCLSHRAELLDREQPLEGDYGHSDGYRHPDVTLRIARAIDSLSPRQKMVFTLRHYHGYKLREIAAMMHCTEGAIKKYLFIATERMRRQLKDCLN